MNTLKETPVSTIKQYNLRLFFVLASYAVLLIGSIIFIKHYPESIWRYPIALLPVLPAIGMVWAFMQFLRKIDELQRRIQLEALGFSFAGTALITFSYGFLQNVGLPDVSWIFVWPIMGVLWSIGVALAHRRY